MKRQLLIFFLFLFVNKLIASHIVGGEIYYDYLGGTNYRITLKVYRDCFNGALADFDGHSGTPDPVLSVFDASGVLFTKIHLPLPVVTNIPPTINNSCITAPGTVCLEEGVYIDTVSLPAKVGGYDIVYQRCCRGFTTLNMTSTIVGATYFAHIPGSELTTINSSPRFTNLPPIFVCHNAPIGLDHSATDPDGDSLVYSFFSPFTGLDPCCGYVPMGVPNPTFSACSPFCTPNNSPPYNTINYVVPFSGNYPLSSSPAININSSTGFLNGTPDVQGQFVVGICVKEYRNGVLLNSHYRDYVFTVVDCIITVESIIKPQSNLCVGNTINFDNQSFGGTIYHWDFGVTTLTNDTSNIEDPIYTFADTGSYQVALMVNPGQPCADTSTQTFYVYPPLLPTFTAPDPECFKNNSFNFSLGGSFASYSTFNWNFGPAATPSASTLQNPSGISFSAPGNFLTTVIINQAVCSDTLTDFAVVIQNSSVNFDSTALNLCDQSITTLTNINPSSLPTSYSWEFSDGTVLSGAQPTHIFSPLGVYNLTLTIITHSDCIDTAHFFVAPFITVNPLPQAGFSFLPTTTTIFDPDIYFFDESNGASSWSYNFGDGNSSTIANPLNTYSNYGDFNVTQIVSNDFNCTNAITKVVEILPEFRFWVPNCFTPGNKDSLNDIFLPVVIGVKEYNFYIFNRWGEMIFKTTDSSLGWDGKFQGNPCEQGEYSWHINFKNEVTELNEQHYGSFMLLK